MNKSLLSINDLSKQEILDLIEFARNFKNDDGSFKKETLFQTKQLQMFSANRAQGPNRHLKLLQKI